MAEGNDPVLIQRQGGLLRLTLNRPRVLNCLNLEMIRRLRQGLEAGRKDPGVRLVLFRGAGTRGFCAGGDVKALAGAVQDGQPETARRFFREEYALDLALHEFPKPIVVLADGVCMGGGLGLAAGADLVAATERTRMAMPETRIGFFPDVGASGWLFAKCPPGYPEFLALTGYEVSGGDCVRVGLATDLIPATLVAEVEAALPELARELPPDRGEAAAALRAALAPWRLDDIPARPEMDDWVQAEFADRGSLEDVLGALLACREEADLCAGVFQRLSERSPTAVVLTWKLLRHNRGRPLTEVFAVEARAAGFMITHPDYREGIRARLLDRDDRPTWQPASFPEVRIPETAIFGAEG